MMQSTALGYKLLLTYDVNTDDLQEYYQFVMGRYLPAMRSLGMEMSEAWHTAYGDAPNRRIGFICSERDTVDDLMENETWQSLNDHLQRYVTDFSYKVVRYRGGFQI
ncbi:MAG: hypothetical protein H6668_01840 [Ardenticatenaceae bacterium]|nr:hypothetical protein [Ardenticatenaceae bacterium]